MKEKYKNNKNSSIKTNKIMNFTKFESETTKERNKEIK